MEWRLSPGAPAEDLPEDDERPSCRQCRVYGGKKDPCVNDTALAECVKNLGQPCPRVVIWPENACAATLVMTALSSRLSPLLDATYEAETAGMRAEERAAILRRVRAVLGSDTLHRIIKAEGERQAAAAEAKARSSVPHVRRPRGRRR